MNVIDRAFAAVEKFRVWGFSGLWSFIVREVNFRLTKRQLRRLLSESRVTVPERGITVVGNLTGRVSLDKTLRDFVVMLKAAGIPYQTYDITPKPAIPERDRVGIVTPREAFDLKRYSHVVVMYRSPLDELDLGPCKRARILFYDSEAGIHTTLPFLDTTNDALIGMSDFNYNYFRREFPNRRVLKVTYPLRLCDTRDAMPRNELRAKYGILADDFVVFFNFDFGSYYRKNIPAAIEAFAKAFPDVPKAKLLFKTKNASTNPKQVAEMDALIAQYGIKDRFVHISSYLSRAEVDGLTGACDVYLSLHKCEGFGIGMAEAMSQGKPVVATDWSANTEFCRAQTAWCVPWKMIPILPHEYPVSMKEWAGADADSAAKMLREIYDDPKAASERALRGKSFLEEHFSIASFKRDVETLLAE